MTALLDALKRVAGYVTDVHGLIDRAKTVLTSAVTWITVVVSAVQVLIVSLDPASPLAQVLAQVVTILLGVVAVIRRVTPVDKTERGLT